MYVCIVESVTCAGPNLLLYYSISNGNPVFLFTFNVIVCIILNLCISLSICYSMNKHTTTTT